MLKHVQISPHRNRSDSVSLRSSTSCASSLCGSPEPPSDSIRIPSRASSYCSLNETIPQTTIKVFTACLRLDIEYKTLGIQWDTTSKEVVTQLLRRCKMRQRDPRLFYLTMEVTVRKAGVRTLLVLDDEARPAILQACHPKGDSRFCLAIKPGGLIRVHTSALQPTSLYKSLVISEETTSDELLTLLLTCCNSSEPVEQFSIYEVCPSQEYQRKLHPDDLPLRAQQQRIQKGDKCHFIVRKNPHYPRRRQLLPPIIESKSMLIGDGSGIGIIDDPNGMSPYALGVSALHDVIDENANSQRYISLYANETMSTPQPQSQPPPPPQICKMCRNNFRSCEFCNKNVAKKLSIRLARIPTSDNLLDVTDTTIDTNCIGMHATTYNPVYNIREIRTVCNSFSSLGIDKKLLDVERNSIKSITLPNNITAAVAAAAAAAAVATTNTNPTTTTSVIGTNHTNSLINSQSTLSTAVTASIVQEAVNNNPAKGYGSYVYI